MRSLYLRLFMKYVEEFNLMGILMLIHRSTLMGSCPPTTMSNLSNCNDDMIIAVIMKRIFCALYIRFFSKKLLEGSEILCIKIKLEWSGALWLTIRKLKRTQANKTTNKLNRLRIFQFSMGWIFARISSSRFRINISSSSQKESQVHLNNFESMVFP